MIKSVLKKSIRTIYVFIIRLARFFLYTFSLFIRNKSVSKVYYIVEDKAWSIQNDGLSICNEIKNNKLQCQTIVNPKLLINGIIHFGSANLFTAYGDYLRFGNQKIMVTFFHGDYGQSKSLDRNIDYLLNNVTRIDKIILSNRTMYQRMLEWGVDKSKIEIIPIGVDLSLFSGPNQMTKIAVRQKLKIADNAIVVGSFQKDGDGWGKGLNPKMIKGPDIFIKVIQRLKKEHEIHVLLTGPSRGYVKKQLDEIGCKYSYIELSNYEEIPQYYKALDYYLISSREEGGPKALMESWACGVPVISTPVGMCNDWINHLENGYLVKTFKIDDIASTLDFAISCNNEVLIDNALNDVKKLDWEAISNQYEDIYSVQIKSIT
jgi:glycosyltransferase involved in cell wall biosynthesis